MHESKDTNPSLPRQQCQIVFSGSEIEMGKCWCLVPVTLPQGIQHISSLFYIVIWHDMHFSVLVKAVVVLPPVGRWMVFWPRTWNVEEERKTRKSEGQNKPNCSPATPCSSVKITVDTYPLEWMVSVSAILHSRPSWTINAVLFPHWLSPDQKAFVEAH